MNEIFKTRYRYWQEVEAAISLLPTTVERGNAFEQFASFYFKFFDNLYGLDRVIFPKETGQGFPPDIIERLNLGTSDYGIDGVCETVDGELMAVQAKFRSDRHTITYTEVSTFWSEAYAAERRLIFTNSVEVTRVSARRPGHVEVTLAHLAALEDDFFEALFDYANSADQAIRHERKTPRPYQESALNDILAGFQEAQRGKLIAACGIGKTLIALWTAEAIDAATVLFVAPNLHLIRQTLSEWSVQASEPFEFLAVCGDSQVADELDEIQSQAVESDVPITTDPHVIASFLGRKNPNRYVFSTYQSLPMVAAAIENLPTFAFDITFFDEAHRTASIGTSTGFTLGLSESLLPSQRRLFMTATERLYGPRAIDKAQERGVLLFSMDDENVYGPTFHRISFREAIDEGIICPYEIVLVAVSKDEFRTVLLDSGMIIDDDDVTSDAVQTRTLLTSLALTKVFDELGVDKMVSYHESVASARELSELPVGEGVVALHVNGSMSSGQRTEQFEQFELADKALLTNARCLIEGVDIPMIDGICFASPKSSLIDIVQAVGRALRKQWNADDNKVARIVIPALVSEETDLADPEFEGLFNVIQAIRDQDETLAQLIDDMNLRVSRGGKPRGPAQSGTMTVIPIGHLSVAELLGALELRVASVNARPGIDLIVQVPLGQGERGGAPRYLRTMADYTPHVLESSLIKPTIDRFTIPTNEYSRASIKINNNNVGHCVKLGVIEESSRGSFMLTPLGERYRSGEISFVSLMQNQMLLYRDERSALYPYRLVLEYINAVGTMDYWDFLFGIYGSQDSEDEGGLVDLAILRRSAIKDYDRSGTANANAKEILTRELNEATGLSFHHNDIWTDRTSAGNQFRYFLRHVELFDEIFDAQPRELRLSHPTDKTLISDLLNRSEAVLMAGNYGDAWWL